MTGAGFGGCTVNLVYENAVEEFRDKVMREYPRRTGIEPDIYVCNVGDGARIKWNSPELGGNWQSAIRSRRRNFGKQNTNNYFR